MKTSRILLRSSRFSVVAISISLALLTASGLPAQTNTTWIGGSSNWNNAGNWSGGTVPTNGAMTWNVFIDGGDGGTNSVVSLDTPATINQLNLDADDILNILDNRQLTIVNNGQVGSGQINNSGLITINSAGNTTALRISGAVSLSGGGTVSMSGGSGATIDGSGTLTNVDNTISGSGNLGANSISIINQGTVQAGAGEALTIDVVNLGAGNIAFDNQNLVLATGGGVVTLTGSGAGEFGGIGTYRADAGSRIDLVTSAVVRNSTFATVGDGQIRMVGGSNQSWVNVTNTGNVVREDNGILSITGTLNNSGQINLVGAGNNTQLSFGAGTTLSGGGSIVMSGTGANIAGNGQTTSNNTISGSGNLGNNAISFINLGTVQAGSGESLLIDVANLGGGNISFDNQSLVLATGGGVVTLTGSGAGEFGGNAGTYRAENGSRIDLVTETVVRNTTFETAGSGEIRMVSGSNQTWDGITSNGNVVRQDDGILRVLNSLNNSGQISLVGAGNNTRLSFDNSTVLNGGGSIVMSGGGANIAGTGQTTNVDNTISGTGNLGLNSISIVNQGTVRAGAGESLTIDPANLGGGNISFDNQNLVLATSGGVVTLNGSGFGEFGGSGIYLAEAGSRIDLVTETVARNTTFQTTGDGEIRLASGSNQYWDGITNTGTVLRQDNGTLTVQNSLINSGQISVVGAGNTTRLAFSGAVNLSGGGEIRLAGNGEIIGGGTLTNADNTISGTGNLGTNSLSVINQGIVRAGATESLVIDPANLGAGNISFDNQNQVLATGGGVVTLNGNAFGEFGGSGIYLAEAGSRIDLVTETVARNTTFQTTGDGEIRLASGSNQYWEGITNTGTVLRQDNGTLTVQNSLINSGQISVVGAGNTTRLTISGAVNLTGGGDIRLAGNAQVIGGGTLTNADNTISGTGNLGTDSLSVINQGIVQAGATESLVIDPANLGGGNISFDNQNLLRAVDGGVVTLTGGGFGEFGGVGTFEANDGTIQFDAIAIVQNISGGTLNSGTWRSISSGGGSVISVANASTSTISMIGADAAVELRGAGSSFTVAGTSFDSSVTANDGSLTVGDGRVLNTSAGLANTGSVFIDGASSSINLLSDYVQSSATAMTQLNGGSLSVDVASQLVFDDGKLTGSGDLFGNATFAAASMIAPGMSAGILNMTGDVGFNGDMRFELMADLVEGAAQDIAIVNRGLDPTLIGFDQINVFGAADLDGMMLLNVSPGFNPMVGDFFDLITADTLTLQPTFSILGNSAYTYDWSVVSLSDPLSGGSQRDVLRAVVLTAIPEPGSLTLLFACSMLGLARRRRRS